MNFKKLTFAAVLMMTAYSTNVVYEQKTGKSIFRTIASKHIIDSVKVTADNFEQTHERQEKQFAALEKKRDLLKERIKEDMSEEAKETLRNTLLYVNTNDGLDNLNGINQKMNKFLEENKEDKESDRFKKQKEFDEKVAALTLEIAELNTKIQENVAEKEEPKEKPKEEPKVVKKDDSEASELDELRSQICEQRQMLTKLTDSLEKLLEDKKEVVSAAAPFDFSSLNLPFVMQPTDFFSQLVGPGQVTEQNPFGFDANFYLMSQMFKQSTPFGVSPQIYYAPDYSQVYNGISPINFGGMMAPQAAQRHVSSVTMMPQQPQTASALPQTVIPQDAGNLVIPFNARGNAQPNGFAGFSF